MRKVVNVNKDSKNKIKINLKLTEEQKNEFITLLRETDEIVAYNYLKFLEEES